MYRGYEADWTTPRRPTGEPVAPRRFLPVAPAQHGVPGPPGTNPDAMPETTRRQQVPQLPGPHQPLSPRRPGPLPGGVFRRFPRRLPIFRILDTGKYLYDRLHNDQSDLPGMLTFSGWSVVCGSSRPLYTDQDLNLPFCGLAGQAVAPEDMNPVITGTETGFCFWEPDPGALVDNRYVLAGVIHRGAGVDPAQKMAAAFWPDVGAYPWTRTLALVDGPFPLSVPWLAIPYLVNSPFAESSARGPGAVRQPIQMSNVRPSVQTIIEVTPGQMPTVSVGIVPYTPQPTKLPFGPKIRERKSRLGPTAAALAAALGGFVNVTTEANDFVVALFKALPPRLQTDFRRTTPFVSPADYILRRTAFVIANAGQIELDQAVGNVLANQIEDRLYGRYFGARRRVWQQYRYWEHDTDVAPRPSLEAPDI